LLVVLCLIVPSLLYICGRWVERLRREEQQQRRQSEQRERRAASKCLQSGPRSLSRPSSLRRSRGFKVVSLGVECWTRHIYLYGVFIVDGRCSVAHRSVEVCPALPMYHDPSSSTGRTSSVSGGGLPVVAGTSSNSLRPAI